MLESLNRTRVGLKGPVTTPIAGGFQSVNVALRKRLANARVRRIRQHEFDRVIVFEMERGGESFRLVVEFFGKGNLILVDAQDTIDLAWRTETFAHRVIQRGQPFKFWSRAADTSYVNDPVFGEPVTGLHLVDGRASYGIGLQTFALGFPIHFNWSWRTLFNKEWEDARFAASGGSEAFRKPRFSVWIGYDF